MEDEKYDVLYEKADNILTKKSDEGVVNPEDILGIMQEISTYRIELEMQNDELEQTRLELEASRDKYKNLYNLAPVAYLTIDKDDTIVDANNECMKLFDTKNELKGKKLSKFITSNSQDTFYLHKQEVFESKKKQSCEIEFILTNGTKFKALLQCITSEEKDKKSINIAIMNLTDIKK